MFSRCQFRHMVFPIDPHHIHGLYEPTYLQKGPLESILYILYGAKCDLDII